MSTAAMDTVAEPTVPSDPTFPLVQLGHQQRDDSAAADKH